LIAILVDHNIEGQAALLLSTLTSEGWIELGVLHFATFGELSLPIGTPDSVLWHFVQNRQMLLLTGNRNMAGEDSLEQTIRRENRTDSLPVVTIASVERILEADYRLSCATKLAEICLYIESYRGTGRLYVP